ncbi:MULTISPECIES: hypothetical protein [unclassified Sphingobium]|uniref:hypothetical protein n=1 Tax=unclassified Sphingobium TaxID=2611147 RepID=UPI002223EF21|nr:MULTISPECIES: hypothetical protein [unclassified Sphingobium]MCW2410413.1 hypothetical protein [Sphingobium sp. B8D3D]MCW2413894.1 hypothetical protein [Sphingobium sp. B8D3A]
MKNLIMGFSTNQERRSVEIFCRSALQSHGRDNCDVVIISNKYEEYFLDLEKIGVKFVMTPSKYSSSTNRACKIINRLVLNSLRISKKISIGKYIPDVIKTYPLMIETWHHPHFARWFAYKSYLEMNRNYQDVFISDVKDVVFQSDVFVKSGQEYLNLFKQHVVYGDDDWDTRWYSDAWGEQELKKILGKPALCIGTIMGSLSSIRKMVDTLVGFFEKYPFRGIEQAGFNYLIYHDMIDVRYTVVENVDHQVATLTRGAYTLVEFDGKNIVRKREKSIIPAVHMYDRFPDTMRIADLY